MFFNNKAFCDYLKNQNYNNKASAFITIGMPFSGPSSEFFYQYNNNLGGKEQTFRSFPIFSSGIKLPISSIFRIGLSAEFFVSKLDDSYQETTEKFGKTGKRSITQQLHVNTFPIILTLDYVPVQSPYKSYAGFGFGISPGNISWVETVFSDIEDDIRRGGNHYNNVEVSPCFRVISGVELNFDSKKESDFLGSLIIEGKFTYLIRYVYLFKDIKSQFQNKIAAWNDSYPIIPFYFGLYVGLTFNLRTF